MSLVVTIFAASGVVVHTSTLGEIRK